MPQGFAQSRRQSLPGFGGIWDEGQLQEDSLVQPQGQISRLSARGGEDQCEGLPPEKVGGTGWGQIRPRLRAGSWDLVLLPSQCHGHGKNLSSIVPSP